MGRAIGAEQESAAWDASALLARRKEFFGMAERFGGGKAAAHRRLDAILRPLQGRHVLVQPQPGVRCATPGYYLGPLRGL